MINPRQSEKQQLLRRSEVVDVAPRPFEHRARAPRRRELHGAINLRLGMNLEKPHLQPNPRIQLHLNPIVSFPLLPVISRPHRVPQQQALPFKRREQVRGILVPLVESRQRRIEREPRSIVKGLGLDVVVVDADSLVGVSKCHVEGEVVVEGGGGGVGEVELGEGGGGDVDLDLVGAEDEPEDEDDDAEDDDEGDEELDEGAEEGAGPAAGAGRAATADGVVVLGRNRGPVVGAVQVSLL